MKWEFGVSRCQLFYTYIYIYIERERERERDWINKVLLQDGLVMVERSDRMWSIGEGNGKPLQYSCLENSMNSMKRQKDRTLKDEVPRSVGA